MICTDSARIETFYQKLLSAKPTSKASVQDVPTVENATKFDLVHGESITSLFAYEEKGIWYVEQPYQGIYETDESLLGLLQA